ncbi:MAG: hypothetical protein GF320_09935 [Armatimonadia bacterium]|nr:hypothetical protein [Armatimonadia bacterium]
MISVVTTLGGDGHRLPYTLDLASSLFAECPDPHVASLHVLCEGVVGGAEVARLRRIGSLTGWPMFVDWAAPDWGMASYWHFFSSAPEPIVCRFHPEARPSSSDWAAPALDLLEDEATAAVASSGYLIDTSTRTLIPVAEHGADIDVLGDVCLLTKRDVWARLPLPPMPASHLGHCLDALALGPHLRRHEHRIRVSEIAVDRVLAPSNREHHFRGSDPESATWEAFWEGARALARPSNR